MRLIDADAFEAELNERLLPILIERYGRDEALRGLHFSFRDCICNIQTQPTIEPEPQWIPCSERLPEPRMAVLGYAPRYQNIYALYYDSVDGWMLWSPVRDDFFPNSQGEIVAWMPLPEPYEEERKE